MWRYGRWRPKGLRYTIVLQSHIQFLMQLDENVNVFTELIDPMVNALKFLMHLFPQQTKLTINGIKALLHDLREGLHGLLESFYGELCHTGTTLCLMRTPHDQDTTTTHHDYATCQVPSVRVRF